MSARCRCTLIFVMVAVDASPSGVTPAVIGTRLIAAGTMCARRRFALVCFDVTVLAAPTVGTVTLVAVAEDFCTPASMPAGMRGALVVVDAARAARETNRTSADVSVYPVFTCPPVKAWL